MDLRTSRSCNADGEESGPLNLGKLVACAVTLATLVLMKLISNSDFNKLDFNISDKGIFVSGNV